MREFGSEFEISYKPDTYFPALAGRMPFCAFTRTGRESIGLAIEPITAGVALLPAYSCWSMSMPFESAGWKVVFYPLKENLTPDISRLEALLKEYRPGVVLVMNYFGFAMVDKSVSIIKEIAPETVVIEDFTHSLFDFESCINPHIDSYVASIRKSIGVPDGGVVLSKYRLNSGLLEEERSEFVDYHIKAGVLKKRYGYSAVEEDKKSFREMQSLAGEKIKADYRFCKISSEAMAILENTDTETVRLARKNNYKHLYSIIKGNSLFSIPFPPGDNRSPFMMVIKSSRRDDLQHALAESGVYCQVLWPLSREAESCCPVSKEMADTMLAVPIDQRYGYYDIEEMGNRMNLVKI